MNEKERLDRFQEEMHAKMLLHAKKLGLCDDDAEPIYDGICNTSGYSESPIKVMWLLKEAWEIDENGQPGKGGWEIWEPWYNATEMNEMWRTMMYVMYGIATGTPYREMPVVDDDMLELLKSTAYININKMPGHTTSGSMKNAYNQWRDIILEQIKGYNPDVIIFGNTFEGLFEHENIALNSVTADGLGSPGIVGAYIGEGKLLVDVWHPSPFRKSSKPEITNEVYVDTIVKAVRGFHK